MNILITGGKGYIGAAMIHQLLGKGHKVICLDLKSSPGRLGDIATRVTMLGGGLPGVKELISLIKEHTIDRIAHMPFFMSAPSNAEQIWQEISVMVAGSVDVYEAARGTGVNRVIFPSSIRYFGPQWLHGEVYLNEDSPSLAKSIYGTGKRLNEVVAYHYNMRAGMSIISLRIPCVYGPGGRVGARGVNIAAVECALNRQAIFPHPPEEKVCVAHIDDVAKAMVLLLLHDNPRHYVYNIGGHTVSYWELASFVREFLPDAQISYDESGGKIELPYLMDYSRIRQEFGFEHRPLSEGYLDLINATRREAELPVVEAIARPQ